MSSSFNISNYKSINRRNIPQTEMKTVIQNFPRNPKAAEIFAYLTIFRYARIVNDPAMYNSAFENLSKITSEGPIPIEDYMPLVRTPERGILGYFVPQPQLPEIFGNALYEFLSNSPKIDLYLQIILEQDKGPHIIDFLNKNFKGLSLQLRDSLLPNKNQQNTFLILGFIRKQFNLVSSSEQQIEMRQAALDAIDLVQTAMNEDRQNPTTEEIDKYKSSFFFNTTKELFARLLLAGTEGFLDNLKHVCHYPSLIVEKRTSSISSLARKTRDKYTAMADILRKEIVELDSFYSILPLTDEPKDLDGIHNIIIDYLPNVEAFNFYLDTQTPVPNNNNALMDVIKMARELLFLNDPKLTQLDILAGIKRMKEENKIPRQVMTQAQLMTSIFPSNMDYKVRDPWSFITLFAALGQINKPCAVSTILGHRSYTLNKTLLFAAVEMGWVKLVELLLEAGADPTVKVHGHRLLGASSEESSFFPKEAPFYVDYGFMSEGYHEDLEPHDENRRACLKLIRDAESKLLTQNVAKDNLAIQPS